MNVKQTMEAVNRYVSIHSDLGCVAASLGLHCSWLAVLVSVKVGSKLQYWCAIASVIKLNSHNKPSFWDGPYMVVSTVLVSHIFSSTSFSIDINECNTNNGGCSEICTNTPGSRVCSCRTGYRLAIDGTSCQG